MATNDMTEAYALIKSLRKEDYSYEAIAKALKAKGIKTKYGKDFNAQNVYMVSRVYKKPAPVREVATMPPKNSDSRLDKEYLAFIVANMENSIQALKKLL